MNKKVEELIIDGIRYVPEDSIKEITGNIKIVVLQRGWSVVGVFERNGSGCTLHNASVIRRWGTTNGLGEIAKNGPLSETKLDKCYGVVAFDYLTVVLTIDCELDKWKKEL
jgi:hypothetical protein